MALSTKRARELARLRWSKRAAASRPQGTDPSSTLQLAIDPASVPPPKALRDGEPAVPPVFVNIDTGMGGRKPWPLHQDLVKLLDAGGYLLLRRSAINYQPKLKVASTINSLDLVAVSANKPGSKRQAAFQEILDQMPGREQLIDWLVMHGFDEGLTFYQIQQAPARDTGTDWVYPSFLTGGFHKENAADNPGEGLRWTGATSGNCIAKPRTYNPWMSERENAAGSFPFDEFIVFNPGGGPSTEGNLNMARVLLPLCSQNEAGAVSRDEFIELFGIPVRAWHRKVEGVKPTAVAEMIRDAAQKAGALNAGEGNAIGIKLGLEDVALIEPKGTASQIILETMKDLRSQVHQIWLGNDLSTTTQDAGPAGSSQLQGGEQNKFIMRYCRLIAAGIAPPIIKWVDQRNLDFPKLEEDEAEIYFQFQPEGRRHLVGLPERAPTMAPVVTGNTQPGGQAATQPNQPTQDQDGQLAAELEASRETLELLELEVLALEDDDGDGKWVTINGQAVHISDEGVIDKGPAAMKGKSPSDIDEGDVSADAAKLQQRAEAAERAAKNAERRVAKRKKALKHYPEGSERRKQIEALIKADEKIAGVQRDLAKTYNERAAKLRLGEARENARELLLAKPTGLVLPPVHPNCRCFLVDGGRIVGTGAHQGSISELADGWYDAQDSKVCRECRVYGAIYNALIRGPVKLTDAEAQAMAAARESKAYKSALERDVAGENAAIKEVAAVDREGIINQTTKARGLAPNSAELNQAIEAALDKSRMAADVQAGVVVRGVPAPEAVIAPPVGAAVRPQFVGAVVAKGQSYTLVQRNYRWHVVNTRTDKVVALEDSLHLGLLVFLALEYANQQHHEKRRAEQAAANGGKS